MIRFLPLFLAAAFLSGCARHYEIVLPNDRVLVSSSKPRLNKQEGIYTYKDAKGIEHYVPSVRVLEIRAK